MISACRRILSTTSSSLAVPFRDTAVICERAYLARCHLDRTRRLSRAMMLSAGVKAVPSLSRLGPTFKVADAVHGLPHQVVNFHMSGTAVQAATAGIKRNMTDHKYAVKDALVGYCQCPIIPSLAGSLDAMLSAFAEFVQSRAKGSG